MHKPILLVATALSLTCHAGHLPAQVPKPAPAASGTTVSAAQAAVSPVLRKAEGIVVPRTEFAETRLSDAVTFLMQEAQRLDKTPRPGQSPGLEIVVKAPAAVAGQPPAPVKRVTLQVSDKPLAEILQTVAKQTQMTVKAEGNVIYLVPQ